MAGIERRGGDFGYRNWGLGKVSEGKVTEWIASLSLLHISFLHIVDPDQVCTIYFFFEQYNLLEWAHKEKDDCTQQPIKHLEHGIKRKSLQYKDIKFKFYFYLYLYTFVKIISLNTMKIKGIKNQVWGVRRVFSFLFLCMF
jgi:hypothetical protein